MKILQTLECTYGVHKRAWEILKYLLKRRGSLKYRLFCFHFILLICPSLKCIWVCTQLQHIYTSERNTIHPAIIYRLQCKLVHSNVFFTTHAIHGTRSFQTIYFCIFNLRFHNIFVRVRRYKGLLLNLFCHLMRTVFLGTS